MKVKINAPAKINLTLEVLDKRNDGYHIIRSLMQSVSLCDEVTVESSDSKDIVITCDDPKIPTDKNNTAFKAAEAFFKFTQIENPGICVDIKKNIPAQAGLAGGSTDAAAVIVALNKMFNQNLNEDILCDIGEKVGADVPFCIVGGTMVAEGIGNILTPVPNLPDCFIVLVKPKADISTGEAYQMVDECEPTWRDSYTEDAAEAVCDKNLGDLAANLYNRFEDVVKMEAIGDIKGILLRNSALGTLMTGSGPTVYGIFENKGNAEDAVDELEKKYDRVYICKPTDRGCTPDD